MNRTTRLPLVLAPTLIALVAACSGDIRDRERAVAVGESPVERRASSPTAPAGTQTPSSSTPPASEVPRPDPAAPPPAAAILDPETLGALEDAGFALHRRVGDLDAGDLATAARAPGLGRVLQVLAADLETVADANPKSEVSSHHGRRRFDATFLSDPDMRFELIGVFNRFDRRAFHADPTCGEVRLLYRLAYATEHGGETLAARLPLTINLVYTLPPHDDAERPCAAAVEPWRVPAGLEGDALATWWTEEGALGPDARARWVTKSLETNLQTIRWQSTAHPSMAGHVEYQMRVFQPEADGTFSLAPLENTPDVDAIARDEAARSALLAFLLQEDTLEAVDQGTLVLPERFLARRVTSVSPRGLGRLANRPFAQLFDASDFADAALEGRRSIGTADALLRRLDAATCSGCHQSASIAGFHHLGEEPDAAVFDGLLTGRSAHLEGELSRRARYLEAWTRGEAPDEFRPFPERQGRRGEGAPCGLGDPGFDAWQCDDGLECVALEDPTVGVCRGDDTLGQACEVGTVHSRSPAHRDRVRDYRELACNEGQNCMRNVQAFSKGMCETLCSPGDEMPHDQSCAPFLDIDSFQKCVRDGEAWSRCSEAHIYHMALDACSAHDPCRSDYVCMRDEPASTTGACFPNYFVMQLRSDGYPM